MNMVDEIRRINNELKSINLRLNDVRTGGGIAAGHTILDGSVHTDSVADAVTRGSILYGNATPKWDELVVGVADTFLGSDGTDLMYRTPAQVLASLSAEAAAAFDWNAQNLTNIGTIAAATGSTIGDLTLANGSITDSGGAIAFGNENLSTTGTIAGVNVTSGLDPGHTHSGAGIEADAINDTHIDWGTGANQVSAVDVPIADAGAYFTGVEVETALQEIYPAFAAIGIAADSAGVDLVGLPMISGTATMRDFIDGISSSLYYYGGTITENAALDGTIDISEIKGSIKTGVGNDMGGFELGTVTAQALAAGNNYICVAFADPPVFSITAVEPNHSTTFTLGQVYKDANDHVHIIQGGHAFTDMPWKTNKRFLRVDGLARASGMVTTEGTEDLTLDVSAGVFYKGINELTFNEYDGDEACDITGAGAGGTISANNKIVLDSGCAIDINDFVHGLEIIICTSSNGNNGCYHVTSAQLINAGANIEITIEEATLNIGNDTGHVHTHTFTYWNYTANNGWIETNENGDHTSKIIDVVYWNDITQNQGSQFDTFTSNRYGVAWVYASAAQDSRVHVVYGQGDYTLAQATAAGPPASLPDLINKMCFLVAKIKFQEGDTDFYSVVYPWVTTFTATGAADHSGLANLDADDHTQYILHSLADAADDFLVASGANTFAKQTAAEVMATLSGEAAATFDWNDQGLINVLNLEVKDISVDTTLDYKGLENHHKKTAGATDLNDDFYAHDNYVGLDQVGGTIGYLSGLYTECWLMDGTVAKDIEAIYNKVVISGGVVTQDVIGSTDYIVMSGGSIDDLFGHVTNLDVAAALTVSGNVYGHYISADIDTDPTGDVYMLYLKELSNIDYGFYQSGSAPNVFGGTIQAATGSTIGNLTLANGSITDSGGAIDFGNENLSTTGWFTGGVVRGTGGTSPPTGIGVELAYAGGIGYVTSYDRNGSAFKPLKIRGDDVYILDGSTQIARFSSNGLALGAYTLSCGTGSTIGNLTLANGSIIDSGGAISFGNENLSTTGTITAPTHYISDATKEAPSKTTGAWSKSIGSGGDYASWALMIAAMPDLLAHAVTVTIEDGTTLTEICELKNKHGVTKDGAITIQAEKYFPTSGVIPTADSATATTLRDAALATAAVGDDYFNGCWVFVVDGTGTDNGLVVITDYVDATGDVVVASWPGTQPDNTSRYLILGALIDAAGARLYGLHIEGNTVPISWYGIGIKSATYYNYFSNQNSSVTGEYNGVYDSDYAGIMIKNCLYDFHRYSGIVGCNTLDHASFGGILGAGSYFEANYCAFSDNNKCGILSRHSSYAYVQNCFGDANGTWGTYCSNSGQAYCFGGTECSGSGGNHSDPGTAGNANADQAAAY